MIKNFIAANPFGSIPAPETAFSNTSDAGEVFGRLLNLFVQILIIGAGIYALINLILAGYSFLGAGDDPKKIEGAWAKIWQTLLGLAFAAGAFILAAIFGQLLFNDWGFILNPRIPKL